MNRRPALVSVAVLMVVTPTIWMLTDPGVAWAGTTGSAGATGSGSGGTVIVGAGSGGTSGGATGTGSPTTGTGRPSGGGGQKSGAPVCTYTILLLNDEGGFPPGGPTPGSWYSVICIDPTTGAENIQTEWISDQAPIAAPAVNPRSLALEALNSMVLPPPVNHFDPAGASVVNLATWLWIDNTLWHPLSVSATAGTVTATAVATPVSVTWSMGDGGVITCEGPGQPFGPAQPAQQSSKCQYIYRTSSAGQSSPDGDSDQAAFPVRATVAWVVSWSAQGAAGGGAFPTMYTSTLSRVRVEQVESIYSEGGQAFGLVPAAGRLSS
jgi:hypothetical protein